MSETNKFGSGAAAVAARSSKVITGLTDEVEGLREKNAELEAKVASYERGEQARKLATAMEEKGLNADMTFDEKVASISSYEDLDAIDTAIKMAGSGNIGLPKVTQDIPGRGGDSKSSLHSFFVHGADAS